MPLGDGIRYNIAKVEPEERKRFVDAILVLKREKFYPDQVSYWDKQEQIHKNMHIGGIDVHAGSAFLPWHREICNRFEKLLQEVDSALSLHYWDWTTDPRSTPDKNGNNINLFTSEFMGRFDGNAGQPFEDFYSSENAIDGTGHEYIWRDINFGNHQIIDPPIKVTDDHIVNSSKGLSKQQQYARFWTEISAPHATAHNYIGGSIQNPDYSFEDPFVFLIHSNVDRLFAQWQTQPTKPDEEWRLDPNQIYGSLISDAPLQDFSHPWSGMIGLRPWTHPDNWQDNPPKKFTDISIVTPPKYDTNGK